jgi:hypothetical protein
MDAGDIYLYTLGIICILLGLTANEDYMINFVFIGIGLMFGPFVYYLFFSPFVH